MYDLYKGKTKKHLTKDIQCKYGGFTFTIDINDVKMPLKGGDEGCIKITMSKPKDLKFNGQLCNAIEGDGKNTITIVNYGEELQFENFTFNKQPYSSDNKTILDTIVETGVTELFENGSFDANTKGTTTYIIPQLHYNKYNTFVIPNTKNVKKVFEVQGTKYDIDEESTISFKPKNPEQNDITTTNKKPQLEFLAIDVEKDNSRKSFDIKDVPPAEIKESRANDRMKAVELDYEEGMDVDEFLQLDNDNNNKRAEWWRKIFCCCDTKNTTNKEPEINRNKLHKFKDLRGIKS